jgi:hypothetical protein
MKPRAHVNRPRCLYTGFDLDAASSDDAHVPSREHVIPLALGGVEGLAVECVSRRANNRAGHEIDDRLASMTPYLMLRQRYKLEGQRGNIPNVRFEGEFADIGRQAWLDVEADGSLCWGFENENAKRGRITTLSGTPEQVQDRLVAILKNAGPKGLNLLTPWGQIKDAEDIDIGLMLADSESGREFRSRLKFDLKDFSLTVGRFAVKVALGAGLLVLGPEWAFGPSGILLRRALFCEAGDLPRIHGTCAASLPGSLREAFGFGPDRHVIGVFPLRKQTFACISLFGGVLGEWIIALGGDYRRRFHGPNFEARPVDCVFTIDLDPTHGKRTFASKSFGAVANSLDPLLATIESDIDLMHAPFRHLR